MDFKKKQNHRFRNELIGKTNNELTETFVIFWSTKYFSMVAETIVFFYQPRVVDPLNDLVFHPPTSILPKITLQLYLKL